MPVFFFFFFFLLTNPGILDIQYDSPQSFWFSVVTKLISDGPRQQQDSLSSIFQEFSGPMEFKALTELLDSPFFFNSQL